LMGFMKERGFVCCLFVCSQTPTNKCCTIFFVRTPISRIPQLGHKEIDLYKLFLDVTSRGGLDSVRQTIFF
jgi:hypothetical protein